jgi:hypothetical protein
MSKFKPYLLTFVGVVASLIVLRFIKPYLPAAIANLLP